MVGAPIATCTFAMRLTTKLNEIWSKLKGNGGKALPRAHWKRDTGPEGIIQIHVVRERYRVVYILCCIACQQRKIMY